MGSKDNKDSKISKPGVPIPNMKGSSIGLPINTEAMGGIKSDGSATINNTFAESLKLGSMGDPEFVKTVESQYARILDSVGLNFRDPMQMHATHFNINNELVNFDPQRPGRNHVFITRPDLNLSQATQSAIPFLEYIVKSDIGKIVCSLLQFPADSASIIQQDLLKTLGYDYLCSSNFDTLKSNCCSRVSGAKDFTMETYETEGDFAGTQLKYTTGMDGVESNGEITLSFEDVYGSPIFLSHFIHLKYLHAVGKGDAAPYWSNIVERIIDYTCSIYVIKTAEDNETIIRWAKWTGCSPINLPLSTLEYSRDLKLEEYKELDISYGYNFYEPMHPRSLADFNTVSLSSPGLLKEGMISKALDLFETDASNVTRVVRQLESMKMFKVTDTFEEDDKFDITSPKRLWSKAPYVVGNKLKWL